MDNKTARKNASMRDKKTDVHFWLLTSLYNKLRSDAKKEGRSATDKIAEILLNYYQ